MIWIILDMEGQLQEVSEEGLICFYVIRHNYKVAVWGPHLKHGISFGELEVECSLATSYKSAKHWQTLF